jgi:hypothetical protein
MDIDEDKERLEELKKEQANLLEKLARRGSGFFERITRLNEEDTQKLKVLEKQIEELEVKLATKNEIED